MAKGYYRQLTNIMKDTGYQYLRQGHGSHEIWWNPSTGQKMTVPFNLKSRLTANGILKDLGIDYRF